MLSSCFGSSSITGDDEVMGETAGQSMSAKPEWSAVKGAVVRASLWRVRESRRQEAKQRDKQTIADLRERIALMQRQLNEWWQWWHCHSQWHLTDGGDDDAHLRDVLDGLVASNTGEPRANQHGITGSGVFIGGDSEINKHGVKKADGSIAGGIDYSKWDHLPEYSSSSGDIGHEGEENDNDESDDAEVACEYLDAKEDELDGDDSWYQEGETRTSGNGGLRRRHR